MTPVWFVLAASAGGLLRHGVSLLGWAWRGTLAVNIVGAFALGWLLGSGASSTTVLVAGIAGCGSLTTFSTFALETVEARGAMRIAIVVATIAGTVLAAAIGYGLT